MLKCLRKLGPSMLSKPDTANCHPQEKYIFNFLYEERIPAEDFIGTTLPAVPATAVERGGLKVFLLFPSPSRFVYATRWPRVQRPHYW